MADRTSRPGRIVRLRADPARFLGVLRSARLFLAVLVGTAATAALVALTLTEPTPLPGLPVLSVAVRTGIVLGRVLLDLSIVAAMGMALVAKFVGFDDPVRTEPVISRVRRAALIASWMWFGAALFSVVLLSAEAYPDDFPQRSNGVVDLLTAPLSLLQYVATSPSLIWDYVRGVPAGKGLLVAAGFGLFSVFICRSSVRNGESVPAELRAGVAAFALLPLPLTGHAPSWKYHDLVMISMELHILAAAAWVGGLGCTVLVLARHAGLLAIALPRFSKLATYCVFVVATTGVLSAIAMLGSAESTVMPQAIWTTSYGQLAIAKLVCVGLIGLVAVRVRRGLLARIAEERPTAITVWCGFELVVMAVAYGLAVVLTRSAPY